MRDEGLSGDLGMVQFRDFGQTEVVDCIGFEERGIRHGLVYDQFIGIACPGGIERIQIRTIPKDTGKRGINRYTHLAEFYQIMNTRRLFMGNVYQIALQGFFGGLLAEITADVNLFGVQILKHMMRTRITHTAPPIDIHGNYKRRFEDRRTLPTLERSIADKGIVLYERA